MDLEGGQTKGFAPTKRLLSLEHRDFPSIILIFFGKLLEDSSFQLAHIALHHFANSYFVPHIIKHIWELRISDKVIFLESNQQIFLLRGQEFGHANNVFEVLQRDYAILIHIYLVKVVFQESESLLDLVPVN